jgi:hypothetical protein
VWKAYCDGQIADIRNYCETDVANTYLVFLRFQLMRGFLTPESHDREVGLVRESLTKAEGAHWKEFLLRWK